ncbi:MAG: transcriptional repressor [Nitrospirae bacterium]|nr:transcriptional repressor [Nitrospirota bacterium]
MTRKQLVGNLFRVNGLKITRQRQAIIQIFLKSRKHLSADELYQRVRRIYPSIGYATVYRTLRLLKGSGMAEERQFGDGKARFESLLNRKHHDHLICMKCGRVQEFEDDEIEQLQGTAARNRGFKILSHKLELYGQCNTCP